MSEESDGSTENGLTLDEMLDLLANHQRRCLLNCLQEEADPTISLDDAASYIANQIAGETGSRPNEDDVEVQLQHHHLPRLTDEGLVDYDTRSGEIRYHQLDQIETFHEHVQKFEET